ncbi:MAG: HEAT repeat domain-containing protein [Planctomycetota bacterium]|jgi:HEAT repeat protein
MKQTYRSFLIAALVLSFAAPLAAHGGTYKPPGDVVPPGGTGAEPPTPVTPPGGPPPVTPPDGPDPVTPPTPPPGPPTPPTPPGQRTGGVTQHSPPPPDLSRWVYWWEFNKDRYLDLKTAVHDDAAATDAGSAAAGLSGGTGLVVTRAPDERQVQQVIMPALLAVLEDGDDRDMVSSAMVALARMRRAHERERVVAGLAARLDSTSQEWRETAALSLGILGAPESIPVLRELALDTPAGRALVDDGRVDLRTRVFSIYGLGLVAERVGEPEVQRHLAELLTRILLEDESALKDLRVAALLALGSTRPSDPTPAVDALRTLLEVEGDDVLVLAHVPHTMVRLTATLPASDPLVRRTVLDLRAIIEARRPARPLLQSAIQALGLHVRLHPDLEGADARILLETFAGQMRRGRDAQTKGFAAISLAYLGSASPPERQAVLEELLRGMDRGNTLLRPWCGLALGVLGFELKADGGLLPAPALEALRLRFAEVKVPERRAAYAIALGLAGDRESIPAIAAAVTDVRESTFRGYAAVSLGLLDARSETSLLADLVDDARRDPDLMRQGSVGLGLLRERFAVTRLVQLLRPEEGRPLPRLAVLAGVASALGYIGDRTAVAPLMATLEDDQLTPLGRAFAVVALGMVADKATLPWRNRYSADLNYRAGVSTLLDPTTGKGLLDIL